MKKGLIIGFVLGFLTNIALVYAYGLYITYKFNEMDRVTALQNTMAAQSSTARN